ncbi:uncharacterized protein LOC119388858 [Rhipicephalus sanguineus]|uniref:uncharacterized protein LOC119388858 n=1 Tax=Rhipicephalus sanguineus TaxID=34632 RepID=UPI0018951E51|nr:uncharacterized protein LOC119388858 [Rhipicephalus sanguineus]
MNCLLVHFLVAAAVSSAENVRVTVPLPNGCASPEECEVQRHYQQTHLECAKHCWLDLDNQCTEGCTCIPRPDVNDGKEGYCFNATKPLPEHFLNLSCTHPPPPPSKK